MAQLRKPCRQCGKVFLSRHGNHVLCSKACRKASYWHNEPKSPDLPTGTIGAMSELLVAADLMKGGWSVFRALSPACFCDLVAYKDDQCRFLEVRTGYRGVNGKLMFSTRLHGNATEFAVVIRRTSEIIYVSSTARTPLAS
jgi:hypothetical protein